MRSVGTLLHLTCDFSVELAGLEHVTPTLPGPGRSLDQALEQTLQALDAVVTGVVVVPVVVKTVIKAATSHGRVTTASLET